jgi:hypothetical protein
MPDLKLAKLPDRTPIRIAITVKPELHTALQNYAALYRQTYGEAESVTELIPYMLESFLSSDRNFAKAVKEGDVSGTVTEGEALQPRRGRRRNAPEQATETLG